MKRFAVLFLIVCLLLCSCGKQQQSAESTGESTESTGVITPADPSQETVPEQTDKQTEPAQTEAVVYRHPLTGAVLEKPWSGQITAVMLNNARDAMPQHGISEADIYYEIEVESGITRCLGLFSELSDSVVIGPIRSARSVYNSVAASFDAPLVHCGGSAFALNAQYGESEDKVPNWKHIDEMSNGSYFFRDKQRQKDGYAFEHTLFTKGPSLIKALEANKLNAVTEKQFGLQFEEQVDLKGEKAQSIIVTFKSGKTSSFTYDADTGLYAMKQFGKDNVDGNTGDAVTFKNVLAIYTDQWLASNGVHVFYETIGSGEGFAAVNGEIVPILWSRPELAAPFTYTLADGTPLTLDVGTSYVALVGTKNPIFYQ